VAQERKVGSVTYREVDKSYFDKRGLKRHAGMWSLWALGVGAVISGEFYGWNFGLGTGGFYGLAIAAVFMAIMYYGLVYSIAEMRLPCPTPAARTRSPGRRWARGADSSPASRRTWSTSSRRRWWSARWGC
jgi:amino acid permease